MPFLCMAKEVSINLSQTNEENKNACNNKKPLITNMPIWNYNTYGVKYDTLPTQKLADYSLFIDTTKDTKDKVILFSHF